MTNDIEKSLGLPPLNLIDITPKDEDKNHNEISVIASSSSNNNVDNIEVDYNFARRNYYDLITTGNKALEDIISLATQSQSSAAYESVSSLIRSIISANKELVNISTEKRSRDIDIKNSKEKDPSNVTNNLFVGTTTELQKFMEQMKNAKT